MIELAMCLLLVGPAGLIAWRWWLDAQRDNRDAQRAHELEMHTRRVVIDQAAVDAALAKVGALEARVKTLEYRPTK